MEKEYIWMKYRYTFSYGAPNTWEWTYLGELTTDEISDYVEEELEVLSHAYNWSDKHQGIDYELAKPTVDVIKNAITIESRKIKYATECLADFQKQLGNPMYNENNLDSDLYRMPIEELILEVKKLRGMIRKHRDSSGHNLCWYWPEMWELLPEEANVKRNVPCKEEFMAKCLEYRASLDKETYDDFGAPEKK